MAQENYLNMVRQDWRDAFLQFTETGQAAPEFLKYLETDPQAQKAVEMAFDQQAQAFEAVAQDLKNPAARAAAVSANVTVGAEVPGKIIAAVEGALKVPESQRNKMIQDTAAALVVSVQPTQRHALRELVDSLGSNLDKLI